MIKSKEAKPDIFSNKYTQIKGRDLWVYSRGGQGVRFGELFPPFSLAFNCNSSGVNRLLPYECPDSRRWQLLTLGSLVLGHLASAWPLVLGSLVLGPRSSGPWPLVPGSFRAALAPCLISWQAPPQRHSHSPSPSPISISIHMAKHILPGFWPCVSLCAYLSSKVASPGSGRMRRIPGLSPQSLLSHACQLACIWRIFTRHAFAVTSRLKGFLPRTAHHLLRSPRLFTRR